MVLATNVDGGGATDATSEGGDAETSAPAGPGDDGENGANSAEAADSAAPADDETPASTAQPPEIAPPAATERPVWLWIIAGLAVVAMGVGAILLLWESSEADDRLGKRIKAEPETPEEAVDEGRALVAAGNYREAVRHLFLAALLTLDERNLIQYDATRTNYELLQRASLRPVVEETLVPVVETFERVWYGFEVVGLAEYEALAGQIDQLKRV